MITPHEGNPGEGMTLPCYPLPDIGERMHCVCDYATYDQSKLCPKCPHRQEWYAAACAELEQRRARGGA